MIGVCVQDKAEIPCVCVMTAEAHAGYDTFDMRIQEQERGNSKERRW